MTANSKFNGNKERGAFTVVALIILTLGTLGMLATITIMNGRMDQVNSLEERSLRRVRELNGRQLAKSYAFHKILTQASGSSETVTLPGNWGRIATTGWTNAAFNTATKPTAFNPASPSGASAPFAEGVNLTVSGHIDPATSTWSTTATPRTVLYRICSRELNLAGYVFDSRRQDATRTVSGNLHVYGKSLVWQHPGADNTFSFRTEELYATNITSTQSNFQVADLSGTALAPENVTIPTLPTWFSDDGVNPPVFYDDDWAPFNASGSFPSIYGRLNTKNGGTTPSADAAISGNNNGVATGSGTATIDLNDLSLTDVVIANCTVLQFTGQTTAAEKLAVENLPPVNIVLAQGPLTTINLTSDNSRPLILWIQGPTGTPLTAQVNIADAADYRLIILAESQPLDFVSGGTSIIRGGLTTDFDVAVSTGTVQLHPETANPAAFENLLWRSYWVESYQQ